MTATPSTYLVPAEALDVEEVIKNSQFITRIRNVQTQEAAKAFIREMNETYADATHNCWAYIVGNPASTTLIGCSDDGEPSGTAGKPMLNVLQHSGLGDIVAVCTRYYGGTKLGTGGLTRAYGGGVKLALEQLKTKPKIAYQTLNFELDYSQVQDLAHLLKDIEQQNLQTDYAASVAVSVDIAEYDVDTFTQRLTNQFKGQVSWRIADQPENADYSEDPDNLNKRD